MSEKAAMNKLFEKLNDLQEVFSYGQKAIPVIYNIIDFMRETIPLLESINHSIEESTSKIPKAKHQINDVTNATELATTEILDLVDTISDELETVVAFLKKLEENQNSLDDDFSEIIELLGDNDKAKEKLIALKNKLNITDDIKSTSDVIDKIKNDAYSITLSLQVQDITSQQLAAVNHLIESVRNKLASLVHTIGDSSIENIDLISESEKVGVTFDEDAKYTKDKTRQDLADSIISGKNNSRSIQASQEEIDKLFS